MHQPAHGHPRVRDALGDAGSIQKDHAEHSSQTVAFLPDFLNHIFLQGVQYLCSSVAPQGSANASLCPRAWPRCGAQRKRPQRQQGQAPGLCRIPCGDGTRSPSTAPPLTLVLATAFSSSSWAAAVQSVKTPAGALTRTGQLFLEAGSWFYSSALLET